MWIFPYAIHSLLLLHASQVAWQSILIKFNTSSLETISLLTDNKQLVMKTLLICPTTIIHSTNLSNFLTDSLLMVEWVGQSYHS